MISAAGNLDKTCFTNQLTEKTLVSVDIFAVITALSTAVCAIVGVIGIIMKLQVHSINIEGSNYRTDGNKSLFTLHISSPRGSFVYLKSVSCPKRLVSVDGSPLSSSSPIGARITSEGITASFNFSVTPPPKTGEALTLKFDTCRPFGIKDRFDIHLSDFHDGLPDGGHW